MAERFTAMASALYAVVLTVFAATLFGLALVADPTVTPQASQARQNSSPSVTGSIVD